MLKISLKSIDTEIDIKKYKNCQIYYKNPEKLQFLIITIDYYIIYLQITIILINEISKKFSVDI